MLQLLVVLTVLFHNSLAFGLYDDIDELDLWPRGVPSTVEQGSECKKDIWILWDNSWSVGLSSFNTEVRPFLKNLITSPRLNVGPDGTHLGIITFSTQKQTRVLLEMGEKKTQEDLLAFLDSLSYDQIKGDGTRTGMALKMADERFTKDSPLNYRSDVSDVVMLFTDGQPIRRRGEDIFGDKYLSNSRGETLLADDRANSLKSKDVTVVVLGIGREDTLRKFRDDLRNWASSDEQYFEAGKDAQALDQIMGGLISASCVDPGLCPCDDRIFIQDQYAVQGGKVSVSWKKPSLKCESGRAPIIESLVVDPPISSPAQFGVGTHTVTYNYRYLRGTKIALQKCLVEIDVMACDCPPEVRVDAKLPIGQNTASVKYTVPEPNCPATLSSVSPPGTQEGSGRYAIGQHRIRYNYKYSGASLSCPVMVTVKGQLCAGVGFDTKTQVCCCGKIQDILPNHECCGQTYYDTRSQACDEFYTLVNRD